MINMLADELADEPDGPLCARGPCGNDACQHCACGHDFTSLIQPCCIDCQCSEFVQLPEYTAR